MKQEKNQQKPLIISHIKPKTQQKQIKTSLQSKKLHNTEKIPGVSHETTKKTSKHVFWRLKITKKTQYNAKNPGWFHVKQEKTAKITTINSVFFAMTSKVVSQGAFFWRVFHVKRCFF